MIKPSSATPCHLKAYNLSVYDQLSPCAYIPIVTFYPPSSNTYQSPHDRTLELKNSLSQTLTQYYPFAGRLNKNSPSYVDCNDDGVEFIEASNDNMLSDFLQLSKHEDLDQLFPNDLIWFHSYLKAAGDHRSITCPLSVQVNHFACGGVAVATSLNHKLGDGRTLLNFINHWARLNAALFHSRDIKAVNNPHLIYHKYQNKNTNLPKMMTSGSRAGCVTTSFLFPNKKLDQLKAKVTAMTVESGQPILNPTRVEVLTWLIHKCITTANTKTNSGAFTPTGMVFPVDMRNILVEKMPGTTIGNLLLMIDNYILLMDTPNDDGIEATVCLEEQDMKTFQNDPELLDFCN
nr:deacetylvindoline O-acetyltransferase [Tanacetum cinerariifolium]